MISFIIPSFNEAQFIKATIETINTAVSKAENINKYEIILINDGSEDNTKEVVKSLMAQNDKIVFAENSKNSGMGASIKKAINLAKYEKFMILPGVNDVVSNSISNSLKNYQTADLIMQYSLNNEEREKFRNVISKIYSLIFLIFLDINVYYINGCSIFPTKKVLEFNLKSNRHGILAEIVTKLFRENITYCEVPVMYKWPHKSRKTITFRNLLDVSLSFLSLFVELKIKKRTSIKCQRKNIVF